MALALWYAALVYVVVWNARSRPSWLRLDPYPAGVRFRMLLPFASRWRHEIRDDDRAWAAGFRSAFLWRCYGVVLLPPLLLFGWLYGTTWMRYTNAVERRDRLERRIDEIEAAREGRSLSPLGEPAWRRRREPR